MKKIALLILALIGFANAEFHGLYIIADMFSNDTKVHYQFGNTEYQERIYEDGKDLLVVYRKDGTVKYIASIVFWAYSPERLIKIAYCLDKNGIESVKRVKYPESCK